MSQSIPAPSEAVVSQGAGRPSFTITDAATACAVSRKTITRKLPELADAGAAKDADGIWRIPVEALLSVGLHPGRSLPESTTSRDPVVDLRAAGRSPAQSATAEATEMISVSRDRWDDLRIRLARAEAESVERGRALDDARLALRALTAGPALPIAALPQANPPVGSAQFPPVNPRAEEGAQQQLPSDSDSPGGERPDGLPPTPVPLSLAADSSVWDTLLPRAVPQPAVAPPPASESHPLQAFPPMPPIAQVSGIPAGADVTGLPRRRWWGGWK